MLKKPRIRRICLALLLFTSLAAWAQQVDITTEVDTHQLPMGGQATLSISVKGEVEQAEEPRFPPLEGFLVQQAGVSRQITIINGQSAAASVYTYILTPRKPGRFTIPALDIQVNGQTMHTRPVTIEVVPAAAPSPGGAHLYPGTTRRPPRSTPQPISPTFPGMPRRSPWGGPPGSPPSSPQRPPGPLVLAEAEVSTRTPYVNEPVTYTFRFLHRVNLDGNPNYEPANATGFLRVDLGQKTYQTRRDDLDFSVSEAKMVFFPTAAGQFTIGPTRLTCRLSLDEMASMDRFTSLLDTTRELLAEAIPIEVRPLPTRGRPGDFTGGVGSFSIKASLDKGTVEQGQPVTLNLEVTGDGHPDLISDPVLPQSDDFKFYKGKSDSHIDHNGQIRSRKTFDIPVVPVKAGRLKIPPVSLSYFDPQEKRYETVTTPSLALMVKASSHPVAPSGSPTGAPSLVAPPGSVRDELALRVPKSIVQLSARPADIPGWAWGLQLVPWLGLACYRGGRRLQAWLTARFQARYSSNLGRRTCATLRRLPENRLEEASGLLYGYLEARLGCKLAGASLLDLRSRLGERGVPPEQCRDLSRLLADLEAYRYAPRGSEVDASGGTAQELSQRAEQLVTRLEGSLLAGGRTPP